MYSLIAMVSIWCTGFFQKTISEKNIVSSESFIFYSYVAQAIMWVIVLLFTGNKFILNESILIYWFLITFLYTFIIESRINSLKYVDSSTYFINYRIFSSILLIILWQILFWEIISSKEYIGIWLGFIIFYLLLEKKNKKESNFDFKKWMKYIFIWVILISVIQLMSKSFVMSGENILSLFVVQGITWIIYMLLKTNKKEKIWNIKWRKEFLFLLINWILFYSAAYFNVHALYQWDVAIVYKIISYSLFIPIILSVIFYNEKITIKKLLAFILTIASIALFV